ncbi:MAG: dTMP kinase [Paraglaciecola sp.]|uniref:dTMP kinase n=1 Tax=Pseudomonadati TaxID=3379134 RepID=UPI00273E73DA|nr:dTMP kinase [Paraglaciecola sp.]MDP5028994.1 dTMP kinase [Paraglaciecola sp.]MDP5130318.1 dTMP kinase [Paraglaciecola sp.]
MQNSGKFIVIEGLEGAGKSSAVVIVKQLIEDAGHTLITTREPGGTPMAEAIRECVKHNWRDEKVTIEAELLLMYAARAQLVQNVIFPAIEQGKWVLGDRHDMSSQAYQGGGRQVASEMLNALRDITLKDFRPDLTLYMDVEPSEGLKRARGRGELDRIEHEHLDFFVRTRERYLSLAKQDERCVIIDTMKTMVDVHQQIRQAVMQFLVA